MQLTSIDNIPAKALDILRDKYSNKPTYSVTDDREKISFGEKREYFLIKHERDSITDEGADFCFIWIGRNLWQFRYTNVHCSTQANWRNPLDLLNDLLKD